jgi:signal transduction histidine kinase
MKAKLALISIIVTISMLGIIYFQADWMYKSSLLSLDKLRTDADQAMNVAVGRCRKQYQDSVGRRLYKQFAMKGLEPVITFPGDSIKIILHSKALKGDHISVGLKVGKVSIQDADYKGDGNFVELGKMIDKKLRGDSLAARNRRSIDSTTLDRFYRAELRARGIRQYFQLLWFNGDTLKISPQGHVIKAEDLKATGTKLYTYPVSSYAAGKNGQKVAAYFYRLPEKRIVTFMAPFFKQGKPLLKNLVSALALSAILVITSILCFVWLFLIIFKQKRLAAMKDNFINNMTHELKTPIATVSAAVEAMQRFNALNDTGKTGRYLETSRKELVRLDGLVTKVLNMAAYQKADMPMVIQELNVDVLLQEVVQDERLTTSRKVDFVISNPEKITTVKADPTHFRHCLANLVDNAVKYSKEQVTITISIYSKGTDICFAVKDNGIGIPASHIKRIFDKFHRVPTGNIHAVKGTGLGLSYVKYAMAMHGGSVTVKSTPGKGSEFTLILPAEPKQK